MAYGQGVFSWLTASAVVKNKWDLQTILLVRLHLRSLVSSLGENQKPESRPPAFGKQLIVSDTNLKLNFLNRAVQKDAKNSVFQVRPLEGGIN